MKTFKTEGIIIKRRNYSEADRLLTVLTKYHGKIIIKASGIRRIPSRRSAHVELLNHSQLSLYKGKNMPVLTEASTIENYSLIKDDLGSITDAYHICELVDGLCPEDQENSDVFNLLKNMLNSLPLTNSSSIEIRKFEIDLLKTLGYINKTSAPSISFNSLAFIEEILERKLKTRRILRQI